MKAELLRKQEEVNKIKKPSTLDPFAAFNTKRFSNPSNRSSNKKKNVPATKINIEKAESEKLDAESREMLAKSKKVLEAKAKLYDKMKMSGGYLNSDDTCLVQFNKKKQDERPPTESSSSDSGSDNENCSDQDDDNKWTEYTDCLGRTRKCLKDDLEFFKKKDRELADTSKSRSARSEEKEADWFVDTKGISSDDLPLYKPTIEDDTMSMFSKSSKMEEQRAQWEQKEQDNLNRDQIHYQDILFNEARTHGVGYYSFSLDATEREKQQKIMEIEREKTLDEQRKREQVRLAREKIIADRVFAAKNRQRARLGLPPLDKEELVEGETESKKEESKMERKQRKREEKERKKKETLEQEREEKRLHHLRPWDHGKDGAQRRSSLSDDEKWEYKPPKPEPMSQEKWNEIKRAERNPDFAPPQPKPPSMPPPSMPPSPPPPMQSFNRFTTIKPKPLKRRNETACGNMFNEPIRNELDGNDFPIDQDETNKRRRAEVPPPAFDYSSSSRPKTQAKTGDLSASIEAGLRFLREKSDKNVASTKQSWVSNTVYEE